MDVQSWLQYQRGLYRQYGPRVWPMTFRDVVSSAFRRLDVGHSGTSVYERDWDLLVILDACRYDLYREVVGRGGSYRSPASMSERWLSRTFSDEYAEEMSRTAYVTGNPFSEDLDPGSFALLDEVWRYAWDSERGTVRAESMVDRAIRVARDRDDDRVIVHMMQPHEPFIAEGHEIGSSTLANFGGDAEEIGLNTWEEVSIGVRDEESVTRAYRANLEYAMEHVQTLLRNVEGEVVITADHGNALGEWGIWGHPPDVPLDCLRTVPWDVRHCSDSAEYVPKSREDYQRGSDAGAVTDRLSHLGYVD